MNVKTPFNEGPSLNFATFRAQGRKLVGDSVVQAVVAEMRTKVLMPLRAQGWRTTTNISMTKDVSDEVFRHSTGSLMSDPLFGNCQLQFELTASWSKGLTLVLVAYMLEAGPDPLPYNGVDSQGIVRRTLGEVPVDWQLFSMAQARKGIRDWLVDLGDLRAELPAFLEQLDEAMAP